MNRLSILIVEDEAIVAEDLASKVRQLGYDVAGTSATGQGAVELALGQRPALVLMDIRLAGDMDGIAAALEIHRQSDVPVLFLTAHSDPDTVERARQAGAFGYILKPFEERDLRIQIEMAISKHAAEQRLRASEERLAGINQILLASLRCESETEFGMACLHLAEQITQSRYGFIGTINKAGLEDLAVSSQGWDERTLHDSRGHHIPHGSTGAHGIYGRVLADGKGLFTNDPAQHPDGIELPATHPPVTSFLGVPLLRDGRVIGILAVANRDGGYNQTHQDTLEALTPPMVEAIMRLRAEAELRDSQERLNLALNSSKMATFEWDIRNNKRYWSDTLHALLGTNPATFTGAAEEFFQVIHPDDRSAVETALALAIQTSPYQVEYRVVWSDGSIHHISARGKVQYDKSNQAVRLTGICWDNSERKHQEQSMRDARKAALNLMQDAITAREQAERAHAALRESEAGERARRAELETLMDALPVAVIFAHDAACQRLTGNRAAIKLFHMAHRRLPVPGHSAEQAATYEIWSEGRRLEPHEWPLQRAVATGQAVTDVETEVLFSDGGKAQLLGSALPLFDESGKVRGSIAAFMDITARKREEQELRRVNLTLRALTASNRAQLQIKTETALLQEVCRIITEVCGFAMVWIGYAEHDRARTVRPVAHAGFEDGYLDALRLSWADTKRGRGPTGTAIRSGQPCQCADMRRDAQFAPWRAEAIQRGYASSLALPLLREDGTVLGAITIYSRQAAGFSPDEEQLLADLACDLVFGITTLRLREAHQRAEAELRLSEERWRYALEISELGAWELNLADQTAWRSLKHDQIFGYEQQLPEWTFDLFLEHLLEEERPLVEQSFQRALAQHSNWNFEARIRRRDGALRWIWSYGKSISDADGHPARVFGLVADITSRKQVEETLLHSERYARSQWAEAETALESIPANIAILDAAGRIVRVNSMWTSFASHNGGDPGVMSVGVNYLTACDQASGTEAEQAKSFAFGIRSVISGKRKRFTMEYPCHSPERQRWFIGYVTAARGGGAARAVVAHVDITAQKRVEAQIRTLNQVLESRVLERTNELQQTVQALEAEIRNRQRLECEILEISEREQSRIGQDLHDGLGQELSGISMLGDVHARQLQALSHPSAKDAAKIANYIRAAIESTRQLAKGFYPIELDRYGLLLALKGLADQTSQRSGIRCELRQHGGDPQLEKSAEIHIYRIVQEGVSNAIKHGRPHRILIESRAGQGVHTFSVTDDGVGFVPPVASSGMGLHLMEYRARVIGANFKVEQPAQGGCRITCWLAV